MYVCPDAGIGIPPIAVWHHSITATLEISPDGTRGRDGLAWNHSQWSLLESLGQSKRPILEFGTMEMVNPRVFGAIEMVSPRINGKITIKWSIRTFVIANLQDIVRSMGMPLGASMMTSPRVIEILY
jgi:hypothetical protein